MTHASVLYTSRGWSSDAGVPEAALDPADVAAIDPARPTKAVLASLLCVIAGYASARLSFHRPGKRRRAMNPLELLGSSIPDPRGLFIQPHPPQRHPGGSGHAKYPREYSTRVRFTVGTCSLPFRHVAILLTGHSRPYAFSHVNTRTLRSRFFRPKTGSSRSRCQRQSTARTSESAWGACPGSQQGD